MPQSLVPEWESRLAIALQDRLKQESVVLLACSGGLDSSCLLDLCAKYLDPAHLVCVHFEHRWSNSSQSMRAFVQEQAERYGIEYFTAQAPTQGQQSEAIARNQRYAFFAEALERYQARYILTAHHLNDQIETFFLRLLRGSAPSGLLGIPEQRPIATGSQIWRPLLRISRDDLQQYAEDHRVLHYQDPSNDDLSISRNHLRQRVLPALAEQNVQYIQRVQDLQDIITADEDYLRAQTELVWNSVIEPGDSSLPILDRECYSLLPLALQRRVLKKLLQCYGLPISFGLIERMRGDLQQASSQSDLGSGYRLSWGAQQIRIEPPPEHKSQPEPIDVRFILSETETQEIALPDTSYTLLIEPLHGLQLSSEDLRRGSDWQVYVDLSAWVGEALQMRTRRARDRFWAINAPCRNKLKSFLIDRKVAREQRDSLLLLAPVQSEDILWIGGVALSELCKVQDTATHRMRLVQQ